MLDSDWSLLRKILFRFYTVYLALFAFFCMIPVGESFPLDKYWNWPVTLTGRWLISGDYKIGTWPNGSGDTTFNYLQVVAMGTISVITSIIWGIADRKRKNYDKAKYCLMVVLRYTLAISMLTYGMAKIIKIQFPYPQLFQLDQRLGDTSPMGLAWTYMGYSGGYNLFTGVAEFLAGFFLFFRRTQLFGALLCLGIMANVVAMNFFYDIPVKIFSAHLLLIAGVIVLPDLQRLITFFFSDKTVPAASSWHPRYSLKQQRITYLTIKIIVVGFILYHKIYSFTLMQQTFSNIPTTPLYGTYEIQAAPAFPDTTPLFNNWKKMYIEKSGMLIARDTNEELLVYHTATDTLHHILSVWSTSVDNISLHYQFPEAGQLSLNGYIGADSVNISLKRKAPDEYLLINRGFHWINEQPYNR
ncbi:MULTISPECIES: hypothetical protein [unclassified Chitinophaga]|uniref:hypothetical protein n=1 Tax=unclassified Chitinophaga TaxID=2619133 RepID=UPI00300F9331